MLDNYFTNVPLFEQLLALGIGAAGTTRVMCGFDGVAPLIVPLYLYYATGLCVYVCVCPNPQVLTLHPPPIQKKVNG